MKEKILTYIAWSGIILLLLLTITFSISNVVNDSLVNNMNLFEIITIITTLLSIILTFILLRHTQKQYKEDKENQEKTMELTRCSQLSQFKKDIKIKSNSSIYFKENRTNYVNIFEQNKTENETLKYIAYDFKIDSENSLLIKKIYLSKLDFIFKLNESNKNYDCSFCSTNIDIDKSKKEATADFNMSAKIGIKESVYKDIKECVENDIIYITTIRFTLEIETIFGVCIEVYIEQDAKTKYENGKLVFLNGNNRKIVYKII